MEAMFVILSAPLVICADIRKGKNIYSKVYGFVIDTEEDYTRQEIEDYVGYLAAMDFWSNHPEEECLFKLEHYPTGIPVWVDKNGEKHFNKDSFVEEVSRHYMKELNLTYDFIKTEIDNDLCDCCVNDDNLIVKDSLYYELGEKIKEGLHNYIIINDMKYGNNNCKTIKTPSHKN